ncbi:MAG: DUF559 domain-containing protein, partial [Mesorhizobium sp.]|nr:DUF559 domain-containing protein [Mesorhizobium sp.]
MVLLSLIGLAIPFFYIVVAWLGWTIYSDLTEEKKPSPPTVYDRRWTATAADPEWKTYFMAFCESPAETAFLTAIISSLALRPDGGLLKNSTISLDMQVSIGRYRADFVINDRLVVEIDGAAYHTAVEAVEYDQIRDEYMKQEGYSVLRLPAKLVFDSSATAV